MRKAAFACSFLCGALLLSACSSEPAVPACTNACGDAAAGAWSELALLAGQPGGQGWVDGPGKSAHFLGPYALAFDGTDHLYLADDSLVRDFQLSSGKVRTIAGSLSSGGADGTGAEAAFFHPNGMVIADGALFLADTENHAIRRVEIATGKVTTVGGEIGVIGSEDGVGNAAHVNEPEGLAIDRSTGQVYIADTDNHTIRKLDLATLKIDTIAGTPLASGTDDGIGAAARFSRPTAVAVDEAGHALFISDAGNQKLRRMNLADASVSTITAIDAAPRALAMSGPDLFAAVESEIVRLSATTGALSSVAGSPTMSGFVDAVGADARFGSPDAMIADGRGGLFVADVANHAVRRVDLGSGAVSTFVGAKSAGAADGTGDSARFSRPQGLVAASGGLLYVADTENHAIRIVTVATGKVATLAGVLGEAGQTDGPGAAARFNGPSGLAFDGSDYLYIAELGNHDLRRMSLSSGVVSTLALTSAPSGAPVTLGALQGLAFDRGHLYATDGTRILAVDIAVSEISVLAKDPGGNTVFASLSGIVADGRGNLLVADVFKNSVTQVAIDTGTVTTFVGTTGFGANRLYYPSQLALRSDGTLFVADKQTVRQVTMDGNEMNTIVGTQDGQGVKPGPLPAQLGTPTAMALTVEGTLALVAENSILIVR